MDELRRSVGTISVESGVNTWHRLIRHRRFDRLWVLVHPVIACEGDRLFARTRQQQPLKLADSKTYRNGVVGLHYQKI
jgi:dihydrofolate reductase